MRATRATGRNAAVLKYDILTALGTHGCAADRGLQRLVLRFVTLIVARYNWQSDELAAGQREIAALWSVDERTVKREFARLRELGWLEIRRASARGRVAVHGLGIEAILSGTAGDWPRVGPDFVARMAAGGKPAGTAPAGNVIAFPAAAVAPAEDTGASPWARMRAALSAENPTLFSAWFAALTAEPGPADRLRLRAPSRFHASFVATHHQARLELLARRIDPAITGVEIGA